MNKQEYEIKLKREIEDKREKLNKIVIDEPNKDEVLKFSQELDLLISEYTKYINMEIKNSRWFFIYCFLFYYL